MKYFRVSLSSPPLEVIEENVDEMEMVLRCPNCGKPAKYGDMIMCSGYVGCGNEIKGVGRCYWKDLMPRVRDCQENDYERYKTGLMYRIEIEEAKPC